MRAAAEKSEPDQGEFKLAVPEGADASSAPLVVCLGWYGCIDKHLAKYSALLNREGYACMRGILPSLAVFSPFAWPRRRWAARLLDAVAAADPSGARPLVFYAFSNGGGFVIEQVDLLLCQDRRYRHLASRTAGIIFDSAPCYMSAAVGATAIGHGLALPLRLLATALFLLSLLLMMPFAPRRPQEYWRNMRDLGAVGRKALYLYSADDPLCCVRQLDELVAARRAAGADVTAVRWERSAHVGHLLKHYREYSAALLGFLGDLRRHKQ